MTLHVVQVGTFGGASAFPLLVAERLGLFASVGLQVTTERTTDSGTLRRGLAEGRLRIAHLAPDNVLAWRDGAAGRQEPLAVSAWLSGSNGPIALVARRVTSIADLHGACIGVDARSSGFAPILRRLLAGAGVGEDDVELVELGATRGRAAALLEGRVDATMLTLPWISLATDAGAIVLADHRAVAPGLLTSCGASLDGWLDGEGRDLAPAYAAALDGAIAWLRGREVTDAAIGWLAEELGVATPVAAATLAVMVDPASGWPRRSAVTPGAMDAVWRLRAEAVGAPGQPPDAYLRPELLR
jgi:NitT/TauT family transport system substrate-binding protein